MVRKILFIFAFILLLSISFSQTYLITKENLEKIFKEIKKEILSIQSYNFKCYFNRICVFDKPIKGFESFFIENKPIFKIQRLESLSILDVYRVWNTSFENLNLTGSNVKIAILDTGIDIKHKDLNYSLDSWKCFYSIDNKVIEGNWSYCNDDNGHGTHVAGIIAARYDGNISKCFEGYVCGAAPNATLFIAKVLDSEGYGTLIDILNALEWAVNNSVDIISMSFGADLSSLGFSSCYPYGSNDADIIRTFDDIMDYIAEKYNIVLIAAAGNNHNSFSSPACAKNVIAVGAIDKNKNLAYFSSRGPIDGRIKPDIVAPGVLISSTFPTNTYRTLSGTSMATPFISGIAALLLEAFKKESINYTSQEIKALVLTSPNELDRNNSFGSGIVNATELIRIRKNYLTSRVYYNETTLFIINASKNNFKITIYRNEFNKSNFANIFLFDSQGNLVKYFSTSDNVIQIKGITAGKYYLLANFVNISNITFAFSEKICEPFNFTCLNNLESFVAGPLLNIVVEEPIEYKINSTHINFSISIKDFLGNFISTPLIVNVTIRNSTNHIVFNKAFSSSKINFVFSPASFDVYSLLIQALSENKWGMIEKSYLFLPYEILTPKNILKLMNGDYLNVTLKLPDNFNISNASIYLPEKPGSIQILSFKNISNIWFNFTRISLNIPGIYYLYLNITSGLNSYNVTFPIFEFNNTFSYLIDFPSKSFAYRSINITFKLYHFNGTELNIDRKICLKNESLNIVCINSSSSNFTLSLNVSFSGIYNLSFLANDTFGNYLVLNKSILISLLPDKLIIEKSKNIFTIFEPLNVSVLAINSSGNQICLICDIYVNISYISGTKSSTVLWNVSSHSIINNIIPPTPNGTYNITFYTKINPLIINSTTVDIITANISTNVSQRVFPNNINISINISIDRLSNVSIEIAKINISGIYSLKPLEDFSATYGCQINSIQGNFLWCNVTNGINLVLNTSETSTYIINITSFNDTANGFLRDIFYSGFLIRPINNPNRFSCDDVEQDIFLNPNIKNHCFKDEKNQKDLAINPNETVIFYASAFAGSTLDKKIPINVSINVSYNNTQIYYNYSYFSENDNITFVLFNFTKSGKYRVTINYTFGNTQKIEEYYIDVLELNTSYIIFKNYTKVGDSISIAIILNRTNSTYYEFPQNISKVISLTSNTIVNSFYYNSSNGTLLVNIVFSQPVKTNLTLYLEDELGIGKNITIYNLTAYGYTLDLETASDTVFSGSQFSVTIAPKLLPDNIIIPYNYSVSVNGNCNLISPSSGSRNDKISIWLNATSEGDCIISVNTNSKYLDILLSDSKSVTISILPRQTPPSEGIPSLQTSIEIRALAELYIKKGYSNSTVIFVRSVGRTQNIFAYILDYPSNLAYIIPRNKTILANDEEPFILNITVPKEENRSEFDITILFNSSYVSNRTKIRIKVIDVKEEININQTKIKELNESIQQIEKEISEIETNLTQQKNEELLNLLLEAKQKLLLAKSKISENKVEEAERLINETREIVNYVKSKVQALEEQKEKPSFNLLPVIITIVVIIAAIITFLAYKFLLPKIKSKKIEKPYYDYKRGKFVWTKEDESVWEKLKEKWRKRQ